MTRTKKSNIFLILIAFTATVLFNFIRIFINSYAVTLPMLPKVAVIFLSWWITLIPILLLIRWDKTKGADLGLVREKLLVQILLGLTCGLLLAAFVVVASNLFNVLDFMVGSGSKSILSLLLNILLFSATVGLVEEFVFRGYIFKKLLDYKNNRVFAILLSSLLFGLSHISNLISSGAPATFIQIGMTTCIGVIFCLFREKIKHFNLLSLIILHGVYDASLPFFAGIIRG